MAVGHMMSTGKRLVPILYGVTWRDLARSRGDRALANVVDRRLNDFEIYLDELLLRIAHA
jgi:hypothetical protein